MDSSASPLHRRRLLSRHVNSPNASFFEPLALTRMVHVGRCLESKLPFISDAISNQHAGQPRLGTAACMFGTLGAAPPRVPTLQAPLPRVSCIKACWFPLVGPLFFLLFLSFSHALHLHVFSIVASSLFHSSLEGAGLVIFDILIPFPSTH